MTDHRKKSITLFSKIRKEIITRVNSLRVLVAVGVALPILVVLTMLSLFHYWQEYHLLEEQERFSATQLGSMLSRSLSHSLQYKDGSALISTFSQVGKLENVVGLQIIGERGDVLFSSNMDLRDNSTNLTEGKCLACHQSEPFARTLTTEFNENIRGMRIASPIVNQPECTSCHQASNETLGILILDVSLEQLHALTISNLRRDIAVSVISTLYITIFTFYLINRFVVQRIEAFEKPILAYSAGDFSVRVSENFELNDEIKKLGNTFNHMADRIAAYSREQEDRDKLRQRAIIEERERIARELHDGLAQVLGYVANKAVAVRLMLKKNHLENADRNLSQLESAAHTVLADMREEILGLRMASQVDADLVAVLREYLHRYNQLIDKPVQHLLPENGAVILSPEIVLQLLRIAQEALANIRKHTTATHVVVEVVRESSSLQLVISDNGCGFDVSAAMDENVGKFGLSAMRERAEEIDARFTVDSEPGKGTKVIVHLSLEDRSMDEDFNC